MRRSPDVISRIPEEIVMATSMGRLQMHDAASPPARRLRQHDAITVRTEPDDASGPALRSKDPLTQPHLVIKRGHLGRYRFTLLTDNGRVSGEVKVETSGASRAEQDAVARAEVGQLAATLVASTGPRSRYS
jgi:hypothetical protein